MGIAVFMFGGFAAMMVTIVFVYYVFKAVDYVVTKLMEVFG